MKPTIISFDEYYTEKFQKIAFIPAIPSAITLYESDEAYARFNDVDYMFNVLRTWNDSETYAVSFSNAVLGLIGELLELWEKTLQEDITKEEIIDEFGDCLYYLLLVKLLLGLPTSFNVHASGHSDIMIFTKYLADIGKKVAFHKKFKVEIIDSTISEVECFLVFIMATYELNLEEVKQQNINKLKERHGERFYENV